MAGDGPLDQPLSIPPTARRQGRDRFRCLLVLVPVLCVVGSLLGPGGGAGAIARAASASAGLLAVGQAPSAPRAGRLRSADPVSPTPVPPAVPTITWVTPGPLTYGTPLGGAQLNARVTFTGIVVPGFLTYTPPVGTILHAGTNQQLLAAFAPSIPNFAQALGSVMITVNPAPTTLLLTISPPAPAAGQPVGLTALISSTVTGVGLPTGSVSFYDGSMALGPAVPVEASTAAITVPQLNAGAHKFRASFSPTMNVLGSTDFAPSQAGYEIGAGQVAGAVNLISSNVTANVGQSIIFSVHVQAIGVGGTPTGKVSFLDEGGATPNLLGSVPLDGDGYARLTVSALSIGGHHILAVYGGDLQYAPGQSAVLAQLVRSCTVSAHLIVGGVAILDGLAGPSATADGRFTYGSGEAQVKITDPAVTYCANPGRSNGQAIVSGTIAAGKDRLRKGDHVMLTVRMAGTARLPDAVLVDTATKQRMAIAGPYEAGSSIRVTTP